MKVDVAGSIRYSWHPGFDQIQCVIRENAQFLTRYGISPRYPGSKIRQNFGTGCGNGTGNGIRDERSSGRGTVVKKERNAGLGLLFQILMLRASRECNRGLFQSSFYQAIVTSSDSISKPPVWID